MKVLILSNNELKEKEIKNTLEELQEIVGGYIEIPFLSRVFNDNKINIIINEEGKYIEGLRPEIAIIKNNKILDNINISSFIIFISNNINTLVSSCFCVFTSKI